MAERTTTLNAILKDSVSGPAKQIRGEFNNLKSSAGSLGAVLQGIGVGIGVGIFNALASGVRALSNAIPDLVNKAFAFTTTVDDLGDATGASAEQASRLIGTFQLLGIGTDGLSTKMGKLAGTVVANEAQINAYGIATRDANGHLLNQVQIADNARSALSKYETGTSKAAIMVKLFGRAGLEMADYLSLSDDQVRLINKDLDTLGVTLGTDTAKAAESAKIEMRRFDLAIQGLANQLLTNILPALIPAISGITSFVASNAKALGQFMAQVVNFVLGMISALTGASFSAVSFTAKLGEVGGAATQASGELDDLTGKTTKSGGASKAASAEYQRQIEHLDRMTESVKRLDEAQDARFQKEIARLTEAVDAQTSAIDVADRQRSVDEQRASSLRDIADAEAAVAQARGEGADPTDSLQRLADVRARAAEFELDQADDTRKAQLEGVKSYIEAIAEAEEEWASKKGLLGQLAKNEAILNSQIAAAQEAGDVQKVADLTLRLEAVKATERRAQMAKANEERIKEFDTQKTRLEELVKAAQAAGSGMGAGISAGAATAGTAIKEMTFLGEADMRRLGASVTGKGGLVGQFDEARLAGEKFGRDIKVAIDTLVGAIERLLGFIGDVKQALDEIARSDIWKALTEPIKLPKEITGRLAPGTVGEAVANDPFANWVRDNITGKALGGPVQSGRTYLVGEQGPELLHMGGNSGAITPNSALGGTTIQPGAIVISGVTDPEAVARAVMQAFQRERQRQGMNFSG